MTQSKDIYTSRHQSLKQNRSKAEIIDTKHPKPLHHFLHRLGWHFMLIKSQQTANHKRRFHCKKTLSQSQNQKARHYAALDWLKLEQRQGSVFDRTYLVCLQTRPICPQYMLILEQTGEHWRFITEKGAYIFVCILYKNWLIYSHTLHTTNENAFTKNRVILDCWLWDKDGQHENAPEVKPKHLNCPDGWLQYRS